MTRSLSEVISSLPKPRQAKVQARFEALVEEVEGLSNLRKVVGKAQTEIASDMGVTQPAISKLEQQSDMYLSSLRAYLHAAGGDLELVFRLPNHRKVILNGLGEITVKSTKRNVIGTIKKKGATKRYNTIRPVAKQTKTAS